LSVKVEPQTKKVAHLTAHMQKTSAGNNKRGKTVKNRKLKPKKSNALSNNTTFTTRIWAGDRTKKWTPSKNTAEESEKECGQTPAAERNSNWVVKGSHIGQSGAGTVGK